MGELWLRMGLAMSEMGRTGTEAKRTPAPAVHTDSTSTAGALADVDTQLMLQVREGNREAASMLFRRNSQRISRYIVRLVGNPRSAEDLTQDVFLQAFRHAPRYQPTAKVTTWLYRIATNTSLNYLKQASTTRRTGLAPGAEMQVPDRHETGPEHRMNLDELKSQVAAAVRGLPVKQRIALTLFEYEDCSYEQIAAVLDVTVEAVRGLLLRARATLRQRLRTLI
jgi:RNA polymerase sigma-70 factor (ECF subfamily)